MSDLTTGQCEQFRAEVAAHALGEPASPELRAHLEQCADCQRELRQDRRVGQALLASAPEVAPSPGLRARLLAAAEAEIKPPAPKQRRRTVPRGAGWGAVAAVVALLLVWNVSLQGQLGRQQAEISTNRANWQTMTALLNADRLSWYRLRGQQANGHFWASPDQAVACLVAEGLPPLPAGQVYQVWLERNQQITNGGLLLVTNGSTWKLIRDDNASSYTSVRVTVEPAGGSAMPSGPTVLQGELTQASALLVGEWQHVTAILSRDS